MRGSGGIANADFESCYGSGLVAGERELERKLRERGRGGGETSESVSGEEFSSSESELRGPKGPLSHPDIRFDRRYPPSDLSRSGSSGSLLVK